MNRFNPTTGKPEPMGPPGLTRYGSAPGSLLASIADSVINSQGRTHGGGGGGEFSVVGSEPMMSRFYPGDSSVLTSSDSSCRTGSSTDPHGTANGSYAFGGVHSLIPDLSGSHKPVVAPPAPALVRHSSSPAGLLSHLLVDPQGTHMETSDLLYCFFVFVFVFVYSGWGVDFWFVSRNWYIVN